VYLGQNVVVEGLVATTPVWALGVYYLPIEDAAEYGLVLQGDLSQFEHLQPGDWVEARGQINSRAGLPLLTVSQVNRLSHQTPPTVKTRSIAELNGFRNLGLWVTTEAQVTSVGENTGGDVIRISDHGHAITVFLPIARRENNAGFARVRAGDIVRITGLASQYCPLPPYNRSFQIVAPSPSALVVLQSGTLIPPLLLLTAVMLIGFMLAIWWIRERRMSTQRRTMRTLHTLSEEIISASSPGEIAEKLTTVLPQVTRATSARMYLYNRRNKSLELVPTRHDAEPMAISIESPPDGAGAGAAICFRNRSLLNIPDVRRSPLIKAGRRDDLPRSLMFVPMFAQTDLVGVIEAGNAESPGYFTHEEQAATQHLANQVATSLKLQEQRTMREQLFRSEKLAATGQLISGVASELRAPLDSILQLARSLSDAKDAPDRDLKTLTAESQRAADMVARLVSFARAEDYDARLVEINELLIGLLQFREPEWKQLGVRVQNRMSPQPVYVLGAQGQLEQVFLNLLVHAEQTALESPSRSVAVASSVIAKRVLIEISYSMPPDSPLPDPFADSKSGEPGALGLGVSRSILHTHSGDIRFRTRGSEARFEVELPIARAGEEMTAAATRGTGRQLTLLLVEPDSAQQRQLVAMLGARGHRVVPCPSPEEAVDLAQRLKFDALMVASRLPGRSWLEVYQSTRGVSNIFVVISDGYDAELARSFDGGDRYLLTRPYQEADIARMLQMIESPGEWKPSSAAQR
jgi:C4-dicarboxylate-specific signal transduction histidine kinase/CheY-like chemotaxis protein